MYEESSLPYYLPITEGSTFECIQLFFFFYIVCHTKFEESSLPYYLHITEGSTFGCIQFPMMLMICKRQITSFKISNQFNVSSVKIRGVQLFCCLQNRVLVILVNWFPLELKSKRFVFLAKVHVTIAGIFWFPTNSRVWQNDAFSEGSKSRANPSHARFYSPKKGCLMRHPINQALRKY